jgi:hypothetical protein
MNKTKGTTMKKFTIVKRENSHKDSAMKRKSIIVKLNDNKIHYELSIWWNSAFGYLIHSKPCLFKKLSNQSIHFDKLGNQIFNSMKPLILQRKTKGFTKFNQKTLDKLATKYFNVKNDMFNEILKLEIQ